jgi:site-specific recombinase XerD
MSMITSSTSTAVAAVRPLFTDSERLALAGFPAGYRGLTRGACTLDLRQFTGWCRDRLLPLFSVRRADIETFAREYEAKGRARATVTRRLCTIAGSCRYAVEEELLEHSPAAHVRRPRLDYESHATGLDRNQVGALLVAAGLGPPAGHALPQRRRGRLDRHGAARIVRRVTRRAGIAKNVGPHTLRHAFITAAPDAGVPLRDVQEAASHVDPRTTMRYDRARTSLDRHATYIVAAFIAGAAR